MGVEIFDSFHNIFEVSTGLGFGDASTYSEIVKKVASITELSDDIHVIGGLIDVEESDDVLMVDLFHDLDFGLDVLQVVGIQKQFLIDYLHRHFLPGLDYLSLVYCGVGTRPQHLFHAELVLLNSLISLHRRY